LVKRKYSPISIRSEIADDFRRLAKGIELENTEALQVCMAAYDIINSTRYGDAFSDATRKAFTEATGSG